METELKSKKLDRIVLDPESVEAIKQIMNQVESELGDLVQVNPKMIGNFILKKRASLLTQQELEVLKNENYDLVKALKRATEEAIRAKQNGDEIDLDDVLKIIQTPSVKSEVSVKKPRGRKKKFQDSNLINHTVVEPVEDNSEG